MYQSILYLIVVLLWMKVYLNVIVQSKKILICYCKVTINNENSLDSKDIKTRAASSIVASIQYIFKCTINKQMSSYKWSWYMS